MINVALPSSEDTLAPLRAARISLREGLPWAPLSDGKSFKPLRFLTGNRGFVELLRLEPGEEIAAHRHTGEVHAFNLEGLRQLNGD